MQYFDQGFTWGARPLRAIAAMAVTAIVAAALASASPSMAQEPKKPAEQAPAKPADKAENAWVKLCEEKPALTGEGLQVNQKICLTHHERLSAVNGMVLVSVAIRNVSGQDKEHLMVLVPLGVALPPGIQVRVDENKPIPAKYTFCHVGGCTAEVEADKEVIDELKKGKKMAVFAINNVGKTIGFPIPLSGFTKAYDGEPVDSEKYQAARRQLMELIQKRQVELAKKAADAARKKNEADKKDAEAKPQPEKKKN